jgi:tetratricopeptide (TPR) repeat protein
MRDSPRRPFLSRADVAIVLTGHVISHYRLLEQIGRDRATAIYRARDLRLDRDVAIKVLSTAQAADPQARERFKREARVASLVSHPHLCAVHDSGEEDGQVFLVCELLEGRALDEVVASGALPPERVLDLGIQLVDALGALHTRGVVHGNVKPSNVFVTQEGHVKLLEVGVMTAWWESLAAPAALDDSAPTASVDRRPVQDAGVDGFHPYRSPEQVAGERVDHRSDLFSAGVVLYDMATGARAFEGETPAEIGAAIVRGRPVPARERNPQLPSSTAAIIERAIQPSPAERYQTASEMLGELRLARRRMESSASASLAHARRIRSRRRAALMWGTLGLAAAVVVGMALRWWWIHGRTPATRQAVLVGSIANGTNDPDFDGTLRQALTVHLGQSPFLDIVSDERLREILQMMGRAPDAPLTHEAAREACERLGLNAMVEGSVSAVGRLTSVALVATDCVTGETITRDQVEVERKEEVLRAIGRLASDVRSSLGESIASLESHNVPIEEATTGSLEALKAYTVGVAKRASGNELESIDHFLRAIELDPTFALAYTMLSNVYGGLGETGRAEEYAVRAYENRSAVSERERLFITYQYHDRVTGDQQKAREALEFWKQTYPRDYRPPNALALLLNRIGDYDRAIAEAQEAVRRNPSHPFPYSNLAYAYRGAGRYEDARRTAEQAVAMRIETLPTRRLLYQLAELQGDAAGAEAQLDWARPRARGFDLTGARAQVLAFQGRLGEARDAYARTVELARRNGFPLIASGYAAVAALGEALYGESEAAVAQAGAVADPMVYAPRLRLATALALAGQIAAADAEVRRFRTHRPDDSVLHGIYLPIAEAAIHLARGRHEDAVEALRVVAPYEHGFVAGLLPMYLRGEARFRQGAYAEAASEFRAVLQYRGADPFSPVVPLAQVGLARSLARVGDAAGSAAAYRDVLATWAGADPDLPVVRGVRAERDSPLKGTGALKGQSP